METLLQNRDEQPILATLLATFYYGYLALLATLLHSTMDLVSYDSTAFYHGSTWLYLPLLAGKEDSTSWQRPPATAERSTAAIAAGQQEIQQLRQQLQSSEQVIAEPAKLSGGEKTI